MDLLVVPVPLFSEENTVEAYMFRYSKGNDLLSAAKEGIHFDGAMHSLLLAMLQVVGLDALTMGKPIFVPVSKLMLMTDLDKVCDEPRDKIIFLIDGNVKGDATNVGNVRRLRELGYRFGVCRINNVVAYMHILELCDFIFYDQRSFDDPKQVMLRKQVAEKFSHMRCVYTDINSMEIFQSARKKYKGLYEGSFYRMPFSEGDNKVSPLQVNMINLLNKVRSDNFEFDAVAKIIQRDPALTISLLRMVNTTGSNGRRNEIKTINGAVVMLGQEEVRKWITAAAANRIGAEKPNEITKLSLIRAKFAEALAIKFGLYADAQSLFLMGVFSVLDAMLEMSMEDALKLVLVSDDIRTALISHTGKFGDVYNFIIDYESANWAAVSRMLILYDLTPEIIYTAYVETLCWYRDMLADDAQEEDGTEDETEADD
ncbi:MAG: HDOD domain-containing protein [Clostridiales Family XIII bacterium]|jgi:EAL and modified HD-GYP domain-containing signal transduction protein|nr:HDOD domain-containing protein [Clostridiales Family XIII bacterium]